MNGLSPRCAYLARARLAAWLRLHAAEWMAIDLRRLAEAAGVEADEHATYLLQLLEADGFVEMRRNRLRFLAAGDRAPISVPRRRPKPSRKREKSMSLTSCCALQVTAADEIRIRRAAASHGVTRSAWLRAIVVAALDDAQEQTS